MKYILYAYFSDKKLRLREIVLTISECNIFCHLLGAFIPPMLLIIILGKLYDAEIILIFHM